jgi:hypothetical protein
MARLKLKTGNGYAAVGQLLMEMARTERDGADLTPLERQFEDLFDDRFSASLKEGGKDDVHLVFHRDRTEQSGLRVVNVVVPDLDVKLRRKPEPGTLDDVAAEAFGYVTIMGCAG